MGKGKTSIFSQILDNISLGPSDLFGLDLGTSAVKVCEVSRAGKKFRVSRYSASPLPEGSIIEDDITREDDVVEGLDKALKKAGIRAKNVCIGLSGASTAARRLQLAGGTREEIEDQVMWEAEQYLPFSIDESSVAFDIARKNEGGGVDVIVCAVKEDFLMGRKEIIETKGLKLKIADMNVLAITNVFEVVMGEQIDDHEASWLILDFGAQKTHFIIVKNRNMAFHKEMNIGGTMITEEIQRQLGVNYREAEDLKIIPDEKGNLPEEITEIVDDVVDAFLDEVKKTIDFYVSSTSDDSLKECLITGGASATSGLREGLEEVLQVPVKYLDPSSVFEFVGQAKELGNEIKRMGVVALGLGMREIEK